MQHVTRKIQVELAHYDEIGMVERFETFHFNEDDVDGAFAKADEIAFKIGLGNASAFRPTFEEEDQILLNHKNEKALIVSRIRIY